MIRTMIDERLEWKFIDVCMSVEDAKTLAAENTTVMLVKHFIGDGYYCGCCGCWLKYDGHSGDCPYQGER
jgi:hypothetical protein